MRSQDPFQGEDVSMHGEAHPLIQLICLIPLEAGGGFLQPHSVA